MDAHRQPNALAGSNSPYLLQHQYNPVEWNPWGEEALQRAVAENKPLLISIGYAACHWCHVMERESFEDEGIAALMNEGFVCIKVDREEHPDVDHLYMEAVQMIHGQGGWPLNVFALPDGRPFYGGTYFRPDQWRSLLGQIRQLYHQDYARVSAQAEEITQGIRNPHLLTIKDDATNLKAAQLQTIFQKHATTFDARYGGDRGAPKFPLPSGLSFLLDYAFLTDDKGAKDHLHLSLHAMAKGGIYDQVGGGFSRYSVDEEWHIPHFEKMLYDNAQLISVYARASHFFGELRFREIALESIRFLETELQQGNGLFSCALDADSEGEEGRYYVWSSDELQALLGEDYPLFRDYFGIDDYSLWEGGKNVLRIRPEVEAKASEDAGVEKRIRASLQKLADARQKRLRPLEDDKVLCSWNAMTIKAYTDAARAFERDDLMEKARQGMEALLACFEDGEGGLFHAWKGGKAYIPGYLEDYALVIEALISLHQGSGEEHWLLKAGNLTEKALALFYDKETALFWFSRRDDPKLVARKMETMDNVIPSSNAVMIGNLLRIGRLTENDTLIRYAEKALQKMGPMIEKYPSAHLAWAAVLAAWNAPLLTAFVCGPEAASLASGLRRSFDPFLLIAFNQGESQLPHLKQRYDAARTLTWVCTQTECLAPIIGSPDIREIHIAAGMRFP